MKRLDDWRARLAAEMDRQRRNPFIWGEHDCAIGFACGIVQALTGEDMAAPYRGRYRTPKEALRLLKEVGTDSLGDFIALHFTEIHPVQARVADLGIVASEGVVGEGVCMFDASGLVVITEQGHGRLPRDAAYRAFRVGD